MNFASSVLSSGKLRASWGELGNQSISNNYYPYLSPIITEQSYPIGASDTPVMGLWQNNSVILILNGKQFVCLTSE